MRKIHLLVVGNLKDHYLIEGCEEFLKRLKGYAEIKVSEVKEEVISNNPSDSLIEAMKAKEGERLLEKINSHDFVVALDLHHPQMSSEKLATTLEDWFTRGGSSITFVIGGSYGLSEGIKKRANAYLTLSELTFTHRFSRLLLLEALYRSFKINNHEPYHK